MSKKFFIILIIIFLIVFGFLIFNFRKPKEVKELIASHSPTDNVRGWAWANFPENTLAASGWISFNCYNEYNGSLEDRCSPSDYGVHIDPTTLKFSGHAWFGGGEDAAGNATPTLGWLSFERGETGAPPFDDPCSDGTCTAKLDDVDPAICDTDGNGYLDEHCGGENNPATPIGDFKQVFGWARLLAGDPPAGGWSGWIKFSGGTTYKYGVTIDMTTSPKEFRGWAWGGGGTATSSAVVGWISFNGDNPDAPGGADYKVITTLVVNEPPWVSNTSTDPVYCGLAGKMRYIFNWTYNDDTNATSMVRYDIKILDSANNQIYFASTTIASYPPPVSPHDFSTYIIVPDDGPAFGGNTYYWYVKVYDALNADSGWVYGGSFTTPVHAYPYPDFAPQPSQPSAEELVTFIQDGTDPNNTESLCYPGGVETLCQNVGVADYSWDFGNGQTSDHKGNATTTYDAAGNYTVTLEITDDVGTCVCPETITIALPLPKWKEIPPY